MADRGHELTDEKIKKMEDELRKEYTQAAAEIENKLKDYMDRFTKKDEIWQKWVKEGKKTPEEYAKWRTGQMAVGKRWEKMKDSIADDLLHVNDIATGIVTGQMPEIFATNANYAIYSAESDAGIDTGLTLYNRDAVNAIVQDEPDLLLPPGQKVSAEIAAGTAKRWEREKIQSVMLQGILQGESIPNLARRLAEKVADSNFKAAVRNARTMSTNAQNLGRYHAYERLEKRGVGITLEWAATLDNRTRHEHRMMHGQRRNVGEPFDVEGIKIMYPAQTGKFMGVSDIPQRMIWNCFTGDNIVDSDSQIIKSYKHIYSGELITIETASGINFTCTPNHPILTRFGWIPAAKLHKGDDLLVTSAVDNGAAGRDRNINHVHSSFEALHESLSNFGSVNQHPMTNFNFHGDVPTSDVEIVSQERLLRGCIDTGISQGFYKTILKNTNSLVFCKRHLMAGFRRIYISALRFVSRRRKALSFFWRGVCHADVHGLGTVTNRDVVLPEYAINNLPAETVIRSQLLNGMSSRVFIDNIISVHKRFSTCHVYNLQTENGYYFVGNSINQKKNNGNYIIAKNCRCTILAWVKGYEHDTITKSDKMGDMTFDEWLKAKEQPEPILKQKEKGDAISGAFNKQYAEGPAGPARPLGSGYTYTPPEPDHGPDPVPEQAAKKRENFDGIGNATKEQASEDWFEYEYASAMAEYIETGTMPKFDINGMEIPDDVRERLAHEANLIQEVGSKTNTKQKTLYRGAVLSEEDARAFTPGETYTTKTLTATTPNRKVADIYTDVENYGGGEGVPVIFEFQKPDGIFGFKRDDNETVLPGGEEFRIVRNYMDEDGVIHIGFYAKKGKNVHTMNTQEPASAPDPAADNMPKEKKRNERKNKKQ